MGDDGGTQPPHGSRDARDAWSDAWSNTQPTGGQHQDREPSQAKQDWQTIQDILTKLKDDLTKEEEEISRNEILTAVKKALRRVTAVATRPTHPTGPEQNTKA